MQLYIDGKQAVIKSGTTFKLTRMNPYFESQGDYTFDVQFPLLGCRTNQRIFGLIHRPEIPLSHLIGKKFPMRLLAPPLDLEGYAEVTNVTETEAKAQLKAGYSAFTHAIEDDETYVDNLELGNAWDTFPSFVSGDESWEPGSTTDEMARMFYYLPEDKGGKVDPLIIAHGNCRQTDSVCFPIYCEPDDKPANPWLMSAPIFRLELNTTDAETQSMTTENSLIAPQPYLLDILQRIIKAAGYTVGDITAYTADPFVSGIFIANSRAVLRRSAALPHWTLPEFLKEVQNFLGCVFVVDGKKRVSMVARSTWYMGTTDRTELADVSDELSTDIDTDGETKNSAAGNVDYDWPKDDDILRIPDEVWENAEILTMDNYSEISQHFTALKDAEKAKSEYLYKDSSTGTIYAILHNKADTSEYGLKRVDHYGPLLRDTASRDISTTLKIVPARITMSAGIWIQDGLPVSFIRGTTGTGFPILVSQDTTLATANYYSVDNAINPIEDEEATTTDSAKDVLEVAWYDGSSYAAYDKYKRPCPVSIPYAKNETTGYYVSPDRLSIADNTVGADGPFSLTEKNAAYGNIGTLISGAASIDSRAQHLFQFTDNIPCDPTVPFLIRGKRYACYKLELTIDERGIQPLKKGYFCEIL